MSATLTLCAGWTLVVALINAIVCPFFRGTRQGLLALHWTAVNTLVAWGAGGQLAPMLVTLIPSSALLLLLETRHTARVGNCHSSRQLHSLSDYISATRDMFIMDVVGLVAIGPLRRALNCALLVGLILFGLHIYRRQSQKEADPKPDDLLRFAHEDMFVNRRDPFQAIGRLGRLDYLCIVALAACDVIQARDCMMVELLTIVRAIATLSLLFTPAFFGGAVQSVKTAGRTAIALRASTQRFVKFL